MTVTVNLIDPGTAASLRQWSNDQNPCGQEIGITMTCDGEKVVLATGRAVCRECGKRIAARSEAIPFFVSFGDGSYNSWKASKAYIHRGECSGSEPE